jgi:hypothetical protein
MRLATCLVLLLAACGTHQSGGMTGPTMDNSLESEPPPPELQSNDILARDAVAAKVKVKHILVGWKDLAETYDGRQDPRGAARSRAEADELARELLDRVRAGEEIDALMARYSEDPGSAATGTPYEVTADAGLVFEFKRLSLRLGVGEAGLVLTVYGWHIIKRTE